MGDELVDYEQASMLRCCLREVPQNLNAIFRWPIVHDKASVKDSCPVRYVRRLRLEEVVN
jgi:hypothetical protein